MRPTHRWMELLSVALMLLIVALVGTQTIPLVGAVTIGAFLVASSVRNIWLFSETRDALSVSVNPTQSSVSAGGTVELELLVNLTEALPRRLSLHTSFPPGVEHSDITLSLDQGEIAATTTASLTFPVAGCFSFPTFDCVATSADGLYTQRIPVDNKVDITVKAHGIGEIHIGTGGERRNKAFGAHETPTYTTHGEELSSIREYYPGDTMRRIDWKASARLDDLYVREYEEKHERTTRLVIDARLQLSSDQGKRTQLNFLREIALGHLKSVQQNGDSIALTIVDNDGVRVDTGAAKTDDHIRCLGDYISELELDFDDDQNDGDGTDQNAARGYRKHANASHRTGLRRKERYEIARALTARLSTEKTPSALVEALDPFFERTVRNASYSPDDPLYQTLHQRARENALEELTLYLTDDADHSLIRGVAKLATRDSGRVVFFVAPGVLFKRMQTGEYETAYQTFVDFEEFRRKLERIPRTTAYEVGPNDRLHTILAQGESPR